MKKYSVSIPWHASVFVEVEAENFDDAKEKAVSEAHPSICCHCSDAVQMDEPNMDAEIDVEEIE